MSYLRLTRASGNLGGTSHTYAAPLSFNAAGQMIKERFGTSTVDVATWQVPIEPYDRRKHYRAIPTDADRQFFGASPDHDPPLVERYYDGDASTGRPGYAMTPEERKASAKDRSMMKPSTQGEQNSQGGKLSRTSKDRLEKLRGKRN